MSVDSSLNIIQVYWCYTRGQLGNNKQQDNVSDVCNHNNSYWWIVLRAFPDTRCIFKVHVVSQTKGTRISGLKSSVEWYIMYGKIYNNYCITKFYVCCLPIYLQYYLLPCIKTRKFVDLLLMKKWTCICIIIFKLIYNYNICITNLTRVLNNIFSDWQRFLKKWQQWNQNNGWLPIYFCLQFFHIQSSTNNNHIQCITIMITPI